MWRFLADWACPAKALRLAPNETVLTMYVDTGSFLTDGGMAWALNVADRSCEEVVYSDDGYAASFCGQPAVTTVGIDFTPYCADHWQEAEQREQAST